MENARYRLRFGNLPPNVTHEDLINRLNIPRKFSQLFILHTNETNPQAPQMGYLTRQRLENQLRQMIDKYHGTLYSSAQTQPIQCQLEVNQEFFEPTDSIEVIQSTSVSASPAPSISSTIPNRPNRSVYPPSTKSTKSWKHNTVKHLHLPNVDTPATPQISTIPKEKPTTKAFKSKSSRHSSVTLNIFCLFQTHFQLRLCVQHQQILANCPDELVGAKK